MRRVKFRLKDVPAALKAFSLFAALRYHGTVTHVNCILYDHGLLSGHTYSKIYVKHAKAARRFFLLLANMKGCMDDADRQRLYRLDSAIRRYEA